jgi:ABC-type uncharacterized transport system permease subunit
MRPRRDDGRATRAPRRPAREYEIAAGLAVRRIEGQSLLLTPTDETLYTLNGTGELVWSLLTKGLAVRRIVDRVAARYRVSRDVAAVDVDAFLAQLASTGALRRGRGPAAP